MHELMSHYLVVGCSSSLCISAKRAASFEQESLISGTDGNNDLSEDMYYLDGTFSSKDTQVLYQ